MMLIIGMHGIHLMPVAINLVHHKLVHMLRLVIPGAKEAMMIYRILLLLVGAAQCHGKYQSMG